jgi:hypothetical protein
MTSVIHGCFGVGLRLVLVLGVCCGIVSTGTASAAGDAPLTELASLRWQQRIIVVDGRIPDAVDRLRAAQQAIAGRDIVWFVVHRDRVQSNYPGPVDDELGRQLQERYVSRPDASVFLIGKDGGLKVSDDRLDLSELFARIDAMPMRQREMEAAE